MEQQITLQNLQKYQQYQLIQKLVSLLKGYVKKSKNIENSILEGVLSS